MKALFCTTLKSEDLEGGGQYRLLSPLVYYSALLDRYFIVPEGFVADSYSVPRFAAFLVHKADRRPAFIHDWLYSTEGPDLTQKQADCVLLEAMKAAGLSWLQRRIIYRGPRLAGSLFFKGGTDANDSPADLSPGA
jgi:hypothetical protein